MKLFIGGLFGVVNFLMLKAYKKIYLWAKAEDSELTKLSQSIIVFTPLVIVDCAKRAHDTVLSSDIETKFHFSLMAETT